MRQKSVLLAFVEAVHLVHKNQCAPTGALIARCQTITRGLGRVHRLPNVFYTTQYRADGDELRIKCMGHQPRNSGLARTRRPPQNATVRQPRFKRQTQRHALAQQVLLTNHFTQGFRAQAFG